MKLHTMKTVRTYQPKLTVILGQLQEQSQVNHLVDTAWNFAYSCLWNNMQFSSREVQVSKEKIREYFELAKLPRKAFLTFCQRILLARHYINSVKGRYLPLPSQWFDKENELGFAGTKEWYWEIKSIRTSLPSYKEELKALAEAVLEYSEEPTSKNFNYWRSYFIEKGTPGLLTLFQVSAINQKFI